MFLSHPYSIRLSSLKGNRQRTLDIASHQGTNGQWGPTQKTDHLPQVPITPNNRNKTWAGIHRIVSSFQYHPFTYPLAIYMVLLLLKKIIHIYLCVCVCVYIYVYMNVHMNVHICILGLLGHSTAFPLYAVHRAILHTRVGRCIGES